MRNLTVGMVVLVFMTGTAWAQAPAPPPQASCEETLAAFRTLADGMNRQRAQLELDQAAALNRIRALLDELAKLKESAKIPTPGASEKK